MQISSAHLGKLLAVIGFFTLAIIAQAQMSGPNSMRDATKTPAIPEGKETDIKLYGANGSGVVIGREALEEMPKAGLVLWLAGNRKGGSHHSAARAAVTSHQGRWLGLRGQAISRGTGYLCLRQSRPSAAAEGVRDDG
jgi:hypothetical protein